MLSEEDRLELARGVPSLRRRNERIAPPVDPDRSRRARLAALGRAVAHRHALRAGVIAIDDLHRAHGAVIEAIEQVIDAAADAGARCAFLLSGRPCAALDALAARAGASRFETAPLDANASAALVASTFGDTTLLDGTPLGAALAGGAHTAL